MGIRSDRKNLFIVVTRSHLHPPHSPSTDLHCLSLTPLRISGLRRAQSPSLSPSAGEIQGGANAKIC
ncbi:hypothetical protein KY290_021576 [Solanum tuberosum]|uniref:Uncharacterized protein n=1 Tax=Solanum tuberosum TaxID=4113 RepID=A0ABQ7V2Z8_SOLTU|nr:hypothetical protein KY289_022455 [Solanum tuberosum]KAH0758083.1 hypothetical protein KY290_021576 [Solanum tuberosum]